MPPCPLDQILALKGVFWTPSHLENTDPTSLASGPPSLKENPFPQRSHLERGKWQEPEESGPQPQLLAPQ